MPTIHYNQDRSKVVIDDLPGGYMTDQIEVPEAGYIEVETDEGRKFIVSCNEATDSDVVVPGVAYELSLLDTREVANADLEELTGDADDEDEDDDEDEETGDGAEA